MAHLSIYASHDSSVCIKTGPNAYRVYEMERILGKRFVAINKDPDFEKHMRFIKELIAKDYPNLQTWGSCYNAQCTDENKEVLQKVFGFEHFETMEHHIGHAGGALWQSPFEKCLIISSDGGGWDNDGQTSFKVFLGDKKTQKVTQVAQLPVDACGAYTLLAIPIQEIYKTDTLSRYLTYAGKLMGLAAYGSPRAEWIKPMEAYFYGGDDMESLDKQKVLGEQVGLPLGEINTISGQTAYDFAATAQHVFETISMLTMRPFIERYKMPICLTGGGALNVLLNKKIQDTYPQYPLFVPCNPNDSGLAFGYIALRNPPDKGDVIRVTYDGVGILDKEKLPEYVSKYKAQLCHYKQLARVLNNGRTIGVMIGNSETGPRALGHRSILCLPSEGMKEKLNSKIKFREEFRPYAPVCRTEDVSTYFEYSGESEFMSYAVKVREEFRDKIPAVVHKDGTARVQTVTQEQNPFLHNLLFAIDVLTGTGVLLNTSLNIKGKPMCTTVAEAISIWQETELDGVYIEGYLFMK